MNCTFRIDYDTYVRAPLRGQVRQMCGYPNNYALRIMNYLGGHKSPTVDFLAYAHKSTMGWYSNRCHGWETYRGTVIKTGHGWQSSQTVGYRGVI